MCNFVKQWDFKCYWQNGLSLSKRLDIVGQILWCFRKLSDFNDKGRFLICLQTIQKIKYDLLIISFFSDVYKISIKLSFLTSFKKSLKIRL